MTEITARTTASFAALGTNVVLKVTNPDALAEAHGILDKEIEAIDRTCSRFRHDSDLTRVNRSSGRWTAVDPLLVEALRLAIRAARLTDSVVDPTIGRALSLAGYDRDWELLEHVGHGDELTPSAPSRGPIHAHIKSGWRAVEFDFDRGLVRVPPGIELDLGATAKAWTADRCSESVYEATCVGVLVSIGGDISVAGEAPVGGWRVHVTDDHRDNEHAPGQTIAISSGGLATSTSAVRRWQRGAEAMHHIIDPTTGLPARSPWRTVSVAAASCADANIASTATLARADGALAWLESVGLPARLVDHSGAVVTTGDWPEETR